MDLIVLLLIPGGLGLLAAGVALWAVRGADDLRKAVAEARSAVEGLKAEAERTTVTMRQYHRQLQERTQRLHASHLRALMAQVSPAGRASHATVPGTAPVVYGGPEQAGDLRWQPPGVAAPASNEVREPPPGV